MSAIPSVIELEQAAQWIDKSGRCNIGKFYFSQAKWKRGLAIPLVYLPIFTTLPFCAFFAFLSKMVLVLSGNRDIPTIRSLMPCWVSHRYTHKNQITMKPKLVWYDPVSYMDYLRAMKWFWVFNCKMYCPTSVAILRQATAISRETDKKSGVVRFLSTALLLPVIPFILIGANLVMVHLKWLGGHDIKKRSEFAEEDGGNYTSSLLNWTGYVVEIIENWWCPFNHEKKDSYYRGALDSSFWHIFPKYVVELASRDRENPIFSDGQPIEDTRKLVQGSSAGEQKPLTSVPSAS